MPDDLFTSKEKKGTWLILFFIKDIYTYGPEVDKVLRRVKQLVPNEFLKVFVLREYSEVQNTNIANKKKISYRVELYEVKYNQRRRRTEEIPIRIKDIPYDTKNSWRELLGYILNNTEVDFRIVFTMSHGNAFGIYNLDLEIGINNEFIIRDYDRTTIDANFFLKIPGVSEGDSDEIIIDRKVLSQTKLKALCKDLEIIWVSEFAKALELSNGQSIDIVIMNNCYMQLFDNGYILKDVVKYLVTPESLMSAMSYDLFKLLQRVNNNSEISLDLLLDSIVDDFKRNQYPFLESTALFANKLCSYGDLLLELEKMILIIDTHVDDYRHIIDKILNTKIKRFDPEGNLSLIDLNNFLNLINEDIKNAHFSKHYGSFFDIMKNRVVIKKERYHIGKEFLENDQNSANPKYGCSGFTISFPADKDTFINNSQVLRCSYWGLSNKYRSPFAKNSSWDNFLIKYFS